MNKIILASASPRRRQLLQGIGVAHEVIVSQVDETVPEELEPEEVAVSLAFQKAADVAAKISEGIVIGADTIVVKDNMILGKPADKHDAVTMLKKLSGGIHEVITGLAVINVADNKSVKTFEKTEVMFKDLNEEEILSYVGTGEPMDKAGAYGIQQLGGLLVKKINGCYFNVVGLPLPLLAEVLKDFNIKVLNREIAKKR